jgi:hypothetical protein
MIWTPKESARDEVAGQDERKHCAKLERYVEQRATEGAYPEARNGESSILLSGARTIGFTLPRLRRAVISVPTPKNRYHCTPRSMAAMANIAVGAARRKRSARKNPRSLVICLLLSTATFAMQNERAILSA